MNNNYSCCTKFVTILDLALSNKFETKRLNSSFLNRDAVASCVSSYRNKHIKSISNKLWREHKGYARNVKKYTIRSQFGVKALN